MVGLGEGAAIDRPPLAGTVADRTGYVRRSAKNFAILVSFCVRFKRFFRQSNQHKKNTHRCSSPYCLHSQTYSISRLQTYALASSNPSSKMMEYQWREMWEFHAVLSHSN